MAEAKKDIIALSCILHDGNEINKGEVACLESGAATLLVLAGAAQFKSKREQHKAIDRKKKEKEDKALPIPKKNHIEAER